MSNYQKFITLDLERSRQKVNDGPLFLAVNHDNINYQAILALSPPLTEEKILKAAGAKKSHAAYYLTKAGLPVPVPCAEENGRITTWSLGTVHPEYREIIYDNTWRKSSGGREIEEIIKRKRPWPYGKIRLPKGFAVNPDTDVDEIDRSYETHATHYISIHKQGYDPEAKCFVTFKVGHYLHLHDLSISQMQFIYWLHQKKLDRYHLAVNHEPDGDLEVHSNGRPPGIRGKVSLLNLEGKGNRREMGIAQIANEQYSLLSEKGKLLKKGRCDMVLALDYLIGQAFNPGYPSTENMANLSFLFD